LSFKDAAEELGLTPTAISHHVRLLEDHCGVKLFRRRPRPLALTPAGEKLAPGLRHGFDAFAAALMSLRPKAGAEPLRVTTTHAFAGRWLVPRLGAWRKARPDVALSVIGTDRVLAPGEADLAIRYARSPPPEATCELFRDSYFPVCAPALVAERGEAASASELGRYPLIRYDWFSDDRMAPMWERWRELAGVSGAVESFSAALSFRVEEHAIEAALAGQGVALFSDIVVADELASGALVKAFDFGLPGYAFYPVFAPDHPRRETLEAFVHWLRGMAASA
jgi:LysR family glycine cleavage system transcriptional activator